MRFKRYLLLLINFLFLTSCSNSSPKLNMDKNPLFDNYNYQTNEGYELFFIYSPKNDLTFIASINNNRNMIYPINIKIFLKSQISYIFDKYEIKLNSNDFECNIYFDLENKQEIITPIKSSMNIYYNFENNN